jgi:hypothetical protein
MPMLFVFGGERRIELRRVKPITLWKTLKFIRNKHYSSLTLITIMRKMLLQFGELP